MVEGLAPPTRAVVHSHETICRRLRIQYASLHMCGVNQFWIIVFFTAVKPANNILFCIELIQRPESSLRRHKLGLTDQSILSNDDGPLCFLRSKVNTAVYQEVLEHFMLPAADQLYGDADFIFQQDLAPAHSAKATSTWFKDHGIPVLNWPANSPDLNPIENLWGVVKRKMRYARPNNAEELKATIRATWALITPEQCHRLIDSMPRRIAAVIQAKGAPTKYWVLYMLILFMFILFSWPRFLKILSLYWS